MVEQCQALLVAQAIVGIESAGLGLLGLLLLRISLLFKRLEFRREMTDAP